jgi:hypothetical protein
MVEKTPKRSFFRYPQGLVFGIIIVALLCAALFLGPGLWWAFFGVMIQIRSQQGRAVF